MLTSIAIIMIYLAYLMVTGPMLKKRLQGQWPPADLKEGGYFTMGKWGLPVNIVAVVVGRRDGAEPGLAARRRCTASPGTTPGARSSTSA